MQLKDPKDIASDSLQSPHDPDMTYGHKGKGIELQVIETCGADNPFQVIVMVQLNGAHVSDQPALQPLVKELVERGYHPDVIYADRGYVSGANIVYCLDLDIDLFGPARGEEFGSSDDHYWALPAAFEQARDSLSTMTGELAELVPDSENDDEPDADNKLGPSDFKHSADLERIDTCAAGKRPTDQGLQEHNEILSARFSVKDCGGCALADVCSARRLKSGDRIQRHGRPRAATDARQREQQEPAFKERYKIRSGIESTNAELKHKHGAARLRVRGETMVGHVLLWKAMALNVKRATTYFARSMTPTMEMAPI